MKTGRLFNKWATREGPKSVSCSVNKLWKILQEIGIPDHLTCLLRNLYVSQEATVRTGFMANRWGNSGNSGWLYFLGLQNHCRWWLQPSNQKTLAPWKNSYDQPRQHIKKQRHYFTDKSPSSQSDGFSSSHVWMWEFDNKESWVPKN